MKVFFTQLLSVLTDVEINFRVGIRDLTIAIFFKNLCFVEIGRARVAVSVTQLDLYSQQFLASWAHRLG